MPLLTRRHLGRFVATLAFGAGLVGALGSDCGNENQCQCFPCTSAVDLVVVDDQQAPLDDNWTVEATLDGQPVDDVANCDPGARTGNECTFGTATGLYRITVRDVGRQTRELAARFAAKSGEDCCRCLTQTKVTAVLDPETP